MTPSNRILCPFEEPIPRNRRQLLHHFKNSARHHKLRGENFISHVALYFDGDIKVTWWLWSPSELGLFELLNIDSSKNIPVTVYDIFVTRKHCSGKFKTHLEISKFLSACTLNTHHHLGKIPTKIKNFLGKKSLNRRKNRIEDKDNMFLECLNISCTITITSSRPNHCCCHKLHHNRNSKLKVE